MPEWIVKDRSDVCVPEAGIFVVRIKPPAIAGGTDIDTAARSTEKPCASLNFTVSRVPGLMAGWGRFGSLDYRD